MNSGEGLSRKAVSLVAAICLLCEFAAFVLVFCFDWRLAVAGTLWGLKTVLSGPLLGTFNKHFPIFPK